MWVAAARPNEVSRMAMKALSRAEISAISTITATSALTSNVTELTPVIARLLVADPN